MSAVAVTAVGTFSAERVAFPVLEVAGEDALEYAVQIVADLVRVQAEYHHHYSERLVGMIQIAGFLQLGEYGAYELIELVIAQQAHELLVGLHGFHQCCDLLLHRLACLERQTLQKVGILQEVQGTGSQRRKELAHLRNAVFQRVGRQAPWECAER